MDVKNSHLKSPSLAILKRGRRRNWGTNLDTLCLHWKWNDLELFSPCAPRLTLNPPNGLNRIKSIMDVHTHDVWVLHVLYHARTCVCAQALAWSCALAKCKHIGRLPGLPVWVANWSRASSQREGSQWKEQRARDAQTDADPGRGEKEERQPRGGEMRRQRDAARSEKMLRQSEEQTSRLEWEPAARRSDRDSEEVCWFTAANWVENLKGEMQLTQWQDKWESALNSDQGRKRSEGG